MDNFKLVGVSFLVPVPFSPLPITHTKKKKLGGLWDTADVVTEYNKLAETNKIIVGVKVARRAPPTTHFLFAYDILIFAKADMHRIDSILSILHDFENLSSHTLNFDKSCVYFGSNISLGACKDLAKKLNMTIEDNQRCI